MTEFITYYQNKKLCIRRSYKGSNCPNWKGGKLKSRGYIYIYKPNHPFAGKRGYIPEHRLVYEKYYNCILLPYVIIHHINGIKDDNRIENLEPMYRAYHPKVHQIGKHYNFKNMSNRYCLICNGKTRKLQGKYEQWFNYKKGYSCYNCHKRLRRGTFF